MKIGVFYTPAAHPDGDTDTIEEDILRGLLSAIDGSGHELTVFTVDTAAQERFGTAGVSWVVVSGLRWRAGVSFVKTRVNRVCAHGLLLPAPFARESWIDPFLFDAGIDIFVNLGPDAISLSVPYVCAAFDLRHRTQPYLPDLSAHGRWERRDEEYRRVLGRATFVITGTRIGRREIERYYQVPRERIVTLPPPTPGFALAASREPRRPRPEYLKPGPFVFYPAQFRAHANHVTLLEAVAHLRTAHRFDVQLVLAGSDQGNASFVLEQIARMGLADAVHVRGVVERSERVALYQHALALTYVSTIGAENLPPLEACALGCPVITSDWPGAREQLGCAALLVPTFDHVRIAEAVLTVHGEPATRDRLVAAGRALAGARTGEQFARGLYEAMAPFARKRKNWSSRRPYVKPLRIGRIIGR
jgi:glycosyltransferase involved in cell wall biosynthesis